MQEYQSLFEAAAAFCRHFNQRPPAVVKIITQDGKVFTLPVECEQAEQGGTPDTGTRLDLLIVSVCTQESQKAQRVARLCRRELTSYFRARLAVLVKAGELVHDANGYRLPTVIGQ